MAKLVWKSEEDLLEGAKENKKRELSSVCQEAILNGFTFEIENQTYHLRYDREAQINLQERWQLFQNNMIESIKLSAYLNNNPIRLEVDKEQFSHIYMESVRAKETKISKLKDELYPIIDNCKTQTELDSIAWEMDTIEPIQLEGLEDYNVTENEPTDTSSPQANEEVEKLNDRVKELEALVTQLL